MSYIDKKIVNIGCTLITICSLPVILLASIAANIEVKTDISTISTQTKSAISPVKGSTGEPDHQVTDVNVTKPNVTENNNFLVIENSNCTYSQNKMNQTNCSSSGISDENVTKQIVTYRDFDEYIHYKNIIEIFPYASNIPGIITNAITIIVAAKIKPHHTSEMYMISLASADLMTVLSRFTFNMWESNNLYKDKASCKLSKYITHVGLIFSNMTLMAWTIERFIAVIFPLKLATWCSVRNTKITFILILIVCLLLAMPHITEFDIYNLFNGKNTVTVCIQNEFMNSVWSHIESFYYIYIPVVCVCACNIAILCRLRAMAKSRMNMSSNQETIYKKVRENRKMTILLLTISGCFLVLHIPYSINLIFNYFYPDPTIFILEDPHFFAKYLFYSILAFLITEYQNSVNFFLYCISGNKFRSTFLKIFCKTIIKSRATTENHSTRSTKF